MTYRSCTPFFVWVFCWFRVVVAAFGGMYSVCKWGVFVMVWGGCRIPCFGDNLSVRSGGSVAPGNSGRAIGLSVSACGPCLLLCRSVTSSEGSSIALEGSTGSWQFAVYGL